jgi:hypothetical protein
VAVVVARAVAAAHAEAVAAGGGTR